MNDVPEAPKETNSNNSRCSSHTFTPSSSHIQYEYGDSLWGVESDRGNSRPLCHPNDLMMKSEEIQDRAQRCDGSYTTDNAKSPLGYSQEGGNGICDEGKRPAMKANEGPLVGCIEGLEGLFHEYVDHQAYLRKLKSMRNSWVAIRRVKKDGCCFYRSLLFGLFEWLVRHKSSVPNFIELLKKSRNLVSDAGNDCSTVDDFYEEFLENVKSLESENADVRTVEGIFGDPFVANYLVVYARLLTSTYLKLHKESFQPFLTNHVTIDEFCRLEVDPMFVEAEHLQVMSLTAILETPVQVVYLDGSEGADPVRHNFPENSSPSVHLLYRPGHYDLIYPKTSE